MKTVLWNPLLLVVLGSWLGVLCFSWISPSIHSTKHSATTGSHNPSYRQFANLYDRRGSNRPIRGAVLLSEASLTEALRDRLERNDESTLSVEGYVLSKRSLGKSLCFVDFQSIDGELCQAMLRREFYNGQFYDGRRRSLLKGSRFLAKGAASPTRNPGEVVLLLHNLELKGLPRQQQHIQIILQLAKDGDIPRTEVEETVSETGIELVLDGPDGFGEKAWMKELAKSLLKNLPSDPSYPSVTNQAEISRRGNICLQEAPQAWKVAPSFSPAKLTSVLDEARNAVSPAIDSDIAVSASGWIQNRRRFEGNITMLYLVDDIALSKEKAKYGEPLDADDDRIACMIHPGLLGQDTSNVYSNICAVESMVWVQGRRVYDEEIGKQVLWVEDIRLSRSSSRSVTIRYLLELMKSQRIDVEEVADALLMPHEVAMYLMDRDSTELRWKANERAVALQAARTIPSVNPLLLDVLEKYHSSTKALDSVIYSRNPVPGPEKGETKMIPVGSVGSKWQSKKRPQLQWMSRQILRVLESHPHFGKRKLRILDIGGGKGALANYLGRAVENVTVHVVDIAMGAVVNGQRRANRLNLPVQFQVADASSELETHADVVVALHACGHLSDVALAHAVNRNAGFVICPCCFCSNPHLRIPGTREVVSDWIGIPETDWSSLKLVAEVQGDIPLANKAIRTICALRAEAAQRRLPLKQVNIMSFPIEYSTRNMVLVGTC